MTADNVLPDSDRVERYEGSDKHVYLIEYFADRFVARTFAGEVYVTGPLPGAHVPDISTAQAARAFAICEIEEKIRAARVDR
jgi:hypothetical protein